MAPFLVLTGVLGGVFLGIKLYEWHLEAVDHLVPGRAFSYPGPQAGEAELFFLLYFLMTGLHALHLSIGVVLCLGLAVLAGRGAFTPEHHPAVEIVGLYWHYVDIVWLFLYPLLYLAGRHLR
jgi:cytochrome c oxidase subunit 3